MKSLVRSPFFITGIALILMPLLASCSPNASAEIISPNLGPIEIAKLEGNQIEAIVAEAPPTLAELSDEEIYAGLPDGIAAAMADADPANGETIAFSLAVVSTPCSGCHNLEPQGGTGPTWLNIGDTAVARSLTTGDPGPAAYLYHSINAPGDYIVPNYTNVMPAIYSDELGDEDFADLIAYLLSQQGG